MRSHSDDPARLTEVGATELERRLLAAMAGERPSPELTRRMRGALPVAAAASAAASAYAGTVVSGRAAPTIAKAAGAKLVATWTTAALLAGGAVIGVSLFARARATRTPLAGHAVGAERQLSNRVPVVVPVVAPVAPTAPKATRERLVDPPAPTPAPARHRHVAPTPTGDLAEEMALIDAARRASRAGAPGDALSLLRRYGDAFPNGTFAPEAAALEIEALSASGQQGRAEELARQFLAEHPDSPLAPRVARFTADGRH